MGTNEFARLRCIVRRLVCVVMTVALCGLSLATTAQSANRRVARKRPALGLLARRGFVLESATGSAPVGMRVSIGFWDDTMWFHVWCKPLSGPAELRDGRLHTAGFSNDWLVGCLGGDDARADEAWFTDFLARAPHIGFRNERLTLGVRKAATLVFKERPLPAQLFRREQLRRMMAPDTPWGPNPVPR